MGFVVTGDLLTDLQQSIENQQAMHISYVDRKGQSSDRRIAPIELRGDRVYCIDLEKMGLRLFILNQITSFDVLDENFDKNTLVVQ